VNRSYKISYRSYPNQRELDHLWSNSLYLWDNRVGQRTFISRHVDFIDDRWSMGGVGGQRNSNNWTRSFDRVSNPIKTLLPSDSLRMMKRILRFTPSL
jgi:hypothetical protein